MVSKRLEEHYKDVSPVTTVKRIQELLVKMGIEVMEEWLPTSYIDTFSLRLHVKGSRIGTNGKGMTKEYARASAYAEFMERLQNRWIVRYYFHGNNTQDIYYSSDEKKYSVEDVGKMDNAFIHMMLEHRNALDYDEQQRIELFRKLHKVEARLRNQAEDFIMVPFYSIQKNEVEYLPYNLYMSYYGSNGMCAGNSKEEALIQGFSEIMERYVNKVVLTQKVTLPDIPDEYVKRFPAIYKMYKKMQELEEYTVQLKDGSLNGKYPVAVLVIIETDTGRYGVKFGSHPDFGIAMERCFTEVAQGGDVTEYCKKSILNFENDIVDNDFNISNSFKSGAAQFPYELLLDEPSFSFVEMPDVSLKSNQELLHGIITLFMEQGKDVLIRDVSYTGFPSFQILIPTISEMSEMTDKRFEYLEARLFCETLFNRPSCISDKNVNVLRRVLEHYSNSQLENTFRFLYGNLINFSLPGDEVGFGWLYMSAMCHVYMGDYNGACQKMKFLLETIRKGNNAGKQQIIYYSALVQYFSGMKVIGNHNKVISYLNQFFDTNVVKKINQLFKDRKKVFVLQYPEHKAENRQECSGKDCCDEHTYLELIGKVTKIQIEKPINQKDSLNQIISLSK